VVIYVYYFFSRKENVVRETMFCLNGKGSKLSTNIFPPILLQHGEWEVALINLSTYNSIPNIEEGVNNLFHYDGNRTIVFPEGVYEIDDISNFINEYEEEEEEEEVVEIILRANKNTLKCELYATVEVDFSKPASIGGLLGFDRVVLEANKWHFSHNQIDINKVNSIRVECNIARGSYTNGIEGHTLHEFFPKVPPGFKIVESPPNLIYIPVNTQSIDNISVQLVDQDGRAINLRGETVTVRLHLRRH
jgi:hypothetical protein